MSAMPWMLVCHCLFALFAFSGDAFFASAVLADLFATEVRGGGRRSVTGGKGGGAPI